MNVDTLRQMYVAELQELCSVEEQLVEALPAMAEAASSAELKEVFRSHLEETTAQRERLDGLLKRHGADPREHVDQAMQSIIREASRWGEMVDHPDLRDAGLIASAQRVEHYEIAAYGSVSAWAKQLGLDEDLEVLLGILNEEKEADEKLTRLAKDAVNPAAEAA